MANPPVDRKAAVLRMVKKSCSLTAVILAEKLEIPLGHASVYLKRYFHSGLLKRVPVSTGQQGIRFSYSLSETGERKIEYIEKRDQRDGVQPSASADSSHCSGVLINSGPFG